MVGVTVKEVLNRAVKFQKQGAFERALDLYAQLIKNNVVDQNILNLKALCERELDRLDEAALTVDQLIKLGIDHKPYFLNTVGLVYKSQGKYQEALGIFNKVLTLEKNDAHYYNNAANVFFQLKKWKNAGALYLKALALDPRLIEAYENLSSTHIKTKNYQAAQETLDLALKGNMVSENILANRIASLVKEDQFDKCDRYLEELVSRYGYTERVVNAKIKILIGKENWSDLKRYVRGLNLSKYKSSVHLNAAYSETLLGYGGRAEQILKKFIGSHDELSEHLFGLISWMRACINLRKGKLKEAWQHYFHRHKWDDFSSEILDLEIPRLTMNKDLEGKRILLCREQGVGDEIMFNALLPALLDKLPASCSVELHCTDRLVPLFAEAFQSVDVVKLDWKRIKQIKKEGGYDFYGYIGDIPCLLKMGLKDFRPKPYLPCSADRNLAFSSRLGLNKCKALKVGLSWRSGFMDKARDVHYTRLTDWIELLQCENIQLICLQYSDVEPDLDELPNDLRSKMLIPDINLKDNFLDLSAVMHNCDLIIAPVNAVLMQASNLGIDTMSYLFQGDNYAFGEDKAYGPYQYPWLSDNNTMYCFKNSEEKQKSVETIIQTTLKRTATIL